MECNKDEAMRAKNIAENKMIKNDFEGGKKFALKAQQLFPELENISQMLAVCDVHCSANRKINGTAKDLYGILQVESSADVTTIKKHYRKLALVLHPDKNRFPGAEAAFKLVGEANMILSDKVKRTFHDYTCREPAKPTFPKPQNPQGNQTSQFGAQNKYCNGHQQSHSDSSARPSFWTICLICRETYEFYIELVNKRIKCLQVYPGTSLWHAGVHSVNTWTNTQPPTSSQQEGFAKQEKVKVDAKRAEPSFSYSAHPPPQCTKTGDAKVDGNLRGKTVENGNRSTEGGKEGVANKGTGSNPSDISNSSGKNVKCSKKSRKRTNFSNCEEGVADLSPEKRSRVRKSSSDVKDKHKEQKEVSADAEVDDILKEEDEKFDSDSEDDSEPVYVDVPDLEFSNFDKDKEEHCFAVDQLWAVYDSVDAMPRFYAQIRKVYSPGFRLRITWLEADPEDRLEKRWSEEGLPIACGKFKHGFSEETKDRLMFSHRMVFEKGSKRFSFVIHPKKGEIWALYKDWDIVKWSSDPESHLNYKFEIVEILSDFDKDNGVLVAYMLKVEGFVSLFQKTSRAHLVKHRVPSSDLFRFSHHIPSLKLTGNERPGVPAGSYELDTASLPDDLDQFYFSNNVKVTPENIPAKMSESFSQSPETKVGSKGALDQSTGVKNKSNITMSSEGNNSSCLDDDVNISSTNFTNSEHSSPSDENKSKIIIHNFNLDKQKWIFEEGQIWALDKSKNANLRSFGQIKKIESSPLRLHVDLLEPCSDAIRPNSCGIYKASTCERQIFQRDSFLYLVRAEVNGRNRFNIYPRKKEIWVLCKKQDAKCIYADVNAGDCDIVEVVENNGDIIKVLSLTHVGGYKSVFKSLERVMEIPIAESHRFFNQVPAVLLTDEQGGCLKGFWELDLSENSGN
ncbi:hypothetical protein R6Q57_011468 [Mikania cordata]